MTAIDRDKDKTGRPRDPDLAGSGRRSHRALRYLPLAVIALALAAGYGVGLQHYLSFDALAARRETLIGFVDANRLAAAAIFVAIYTTAVALSFPAASVLTIFGGFLFGWLIGGLLTVAAATTGAVLIFLATRTAFGDLLKRRAGPALAKLASGLERDAFGYLLVLRLAPVFPFFLVNIAPGFFGVRLRTFFTATVLGILPGTFAYAYLGQGIDSIILSAARAGRHVTPGDLVTPEITIAFAALAVVAAIPLAFRKLRR